jgi:hypothetical protein
MPPLGGLMPPLGGPLLGAPPQQQQQSPTVTGAACPRGNGMATTVTKNATFYSVSVTNCPQYSPYGQTTPNTPTYGNVTLVRPHPICSCASCGL